MRNRIDAFISFFLIVILLAILHGEAFSQSFDIKQISEAYIGQPVAFEVTGDSAENENVGFEWAFSDNVTSILIGKGGRSSSFIVLNSSPVALNLKVISESGNVISEAFLTTAAREFSVQIRHIPAEMLRIWNLETHMEDTAEEYAVNQKFSFEALVFPEIEEKFNYKWKTSQGVLFDISEDGKGITVWRETPGICSIEVEISNRNGVLLGKGVTLAEVVISDAEIDQSEKRKKAWGKWQEALKTWNDSGFMNVAGYEKALGLALEASSTNGDDLEIVDGAEKMKTDNALIQRAKQYALEGDAFREREKWTECLVSYRRSLAIWRFSETEKAISEIEDTVRTIRLDRENAGWKRDMAKAYEEEKRYEDAIKAYDESLLIDRQEEAIKGRERSETLLINYQVAAVLKKEAEKLILSGNYSGAVDKYKESLALHDDEEISQKLQGMENLISSLKAKALQLRREGNEHAKRRRNADALASYTESMRTWKDAAAEDLVRKFEGIVPEDQRLPDKNAESSVPEKNHEAARLLSEATEFYRAGNYEEALNRYRKSYEIEEDPELKDWIQRIEGNIKAQASIAESNRLIREGNALYSIRRYNEALKSYRASVELYPNKEVDDFIRHIEEVLYMR